MSNKGSKIGAVFAGPIFERLLTLVIWLGGVISTILIMCTFALTIYAIIWRYLLNSPPIWTDELTGYLLVAFIMFGTAEAYRRGNHIKIDLLVGKLSGNKATLALIWSDLCVLAFAVILGVSAWESIAFARVFGSFSSGAIEIETWIPQLPLLVASALLTLVSITKIIGSVKKAIKS